MSAARGLVAGVAGLALLEAIVSNNAAAGRVGGAFTLVAGVLSHWLDPNVALIPDLRKGTPSPFGQQPPGTVVSAQVYTTPRRVAATPKPPTTVSA
jgi:hypothetical protein